MSKERQTPAERRLQLLERIGKAADEIARIDCRQSLLQNKEQEHV
jgi:hypothetical protein